MVCGDVGFEGVAGVGEGGVLVVADVVFGFVPDVFDGVVVGCVGWGVDEVDVLEGVSLTEVGAEVFRGVPYGITGNQQRALVRRLPRVEEGGQVEIGNSSEPFTARTQAIDHLEFASFLDLPPALGDGDRPGPGNGGDIEAYSQTARRPAKPLVRAHLRKTVNKAHCWWISAQRHDLG